MFLMSERGSLVYVVFSPQESTKNRFYSAYHMCLQGDPSNQGADNGGIYS
jgi:hypothetical protein